VTPLMSCCRKISIRHPESARAPADASKRRAAPQCCGFGGVLRVWGFLERGLRLRPALEHA
jgi:hypothetical protein